MKRCRPFLAAAVTALFLPGCLLIRTTEHRIKLNDDGSGEAYMRLVDIRSDGVTDSARIRDFGVMMASADKEGVKDFEGPGRKVTSREFVVSGDTLSVQVNYTFRGIDYVEGLKATDDNLYVVINDGREIVRTNGKIRSGENKTRQIVWPRGAKRLMFEIREKNQPAGTSLAALYTHYINQKKEGAH
jgi:hypothetical protein